MCGCFSSNRGPGQQPRHVPWLGIEPAALWFTSWQSILWATPARTEILFEILDFVNLIVFLKLEEWIHFLFWYLFSLVKQWWLPPSQSQQESPIWGVMKKENSFGSNSSMIIQCGLWKQHCCRTAWEGSCPPLHNGRPWSQVPLHLHSSSMVLSALSCLSLVCAFMLHPPLSALWDVFGASAIAGETVFSVGWKMHSWS